VGISPEAKLAHWDRVADLRQRRQRFLVSGISGRALTSVPDPAMSADPNPVIYALIV